MASSESVLVLHGGHVFDGENAPRLATVIVEGSTIRAVVPPDATIDTPPDARVLEVRGRLVVPAIIDAHTHLLSGGDLEAYERELLKDSLPLRTLRAAAHARMAVDHGVLTMRDVCTEGASYADVALRDAVRAGLVEGPRVIPSGPGVGITGGYMPMGYAPHVCIPAGCSIVDGADAARREVRTQVSHGVSWIKVFADWFSHDRDRPTFTRPELEAIVDEASRRGVRVAAHATTDEGARAAIECGVASIEHMGALSRETLDLAAVRGVFLVPTLSVLDAMRRRPGLTEATSEKMKRRWEVTAEAFGRAIASGVRIVCGTDIGCYPHAAGSLSEIGLMIDLGLPPIASLRAATSEAATALGLDTLGRLVEGAIADVCVFDAPAGPDDLASAMRVGKPRWVIQAGRIVREPAL